MHACSNDDGIDKSVIKVLSYRTTIYIHVVYYIISCCNAQRYITLCVHASKTEFFENALAEYRVTRVPERSYGLASLFAYTHLI